MPDQANVLNIPCDRCNVGWMVITADPRTLKPVELRCSHAPHCRATQPLPPALLMREAGAQPLPGLD